MFVNWSVLVGEAPSAAAPMPEPIPEFGAYSFRNNSVGTKCINQRREYLEFTRFCESFDMAFILKYLGLNFGM